MVKETDPLDNRRSWVRIGASWAAIIFIFVLAPAFVGMLYFTEEKDKAFDLFHVIFPVATGIISYWFASRKTPSDGGSPK